MPGVEIRPHDNVETRALIGSTDWAATPLGPADRWPASLRSYVDMILGLPTPAIIFWGSEQTQIYNDGYALIMGPRHPRYFGATYRECWPDTYPVIYPWMRRVLDHGEVVTVEETEITVTRFGFPEEAFFTFTFSPLRDDGGQIVGIYQPVVEVTSPVLAARRTAALAEITARADGIDPASDRRTVLGTDARDIPVMVVATAESGDARPRVVAATENVADRGLPEAFTAALGDVIRTGKERRLTGIDGLVGATGPWPEPTREAIVVPMRSAPRRRPFGAILFGLGARLQVDDAYRSFLRQVSAQVGGSLHRGSLRRSEEVARADLEVATETVRHRTEQFEQLIRMAPIGVFLVDAAFRMRVVNPVARPVFGHDEPVGRDFRELIRSTTLPESADELVRIFQRVLDTGESYAERDRAERRLDGTGVVHYDWRIDRMPLLDGESGLVCYFRDVSEEVAARTALEETNRRKDEFLAMLGHELRNPLGPIRAGAELLRSADATPEARQRTVDIIERQTRHLSRLVDDLLDVSRIMQGKVDLAAERIAVASVVDQAVETTRAMFDARQQRLTVGTSVDAAHVRGDETRLVQVVANLLHNASKYTPDGGSIALEVGVDGGEIAIAVRDDGVGMPAELVPNVFDLFVQGDVSLDRSRGGLGIGLTLARQLVQLHGGTITAASEGVGSGSEFTVRLPLDASSTAAEGAARPATRRAGPAIRRVLVVDDNVDMAETIAAMLEIEGHAVHVAHSGAAALDLVDGTVPDVVVCDIGLPGMDGYELARRMRERARPVRLVALSGYGHDEARRRAVDAGFDVYLVKPVDLDTILEVIADAPAPSSPGTITG